MSTVWEGEFERSPARYFYMSNPLCSTMVWAIDLDDGTMIEALGKGIKRRKATVVEPPKVIECFGSSDMNKDEL